MAQETKRDKREDLFAAIPPLEAKKMLISKAITEGVGFLELNDVKRAYFHARARISFYVELPEEDYEEGRCGS